MDKKYEYLDHTADAKIIGYGNNLEKAFSNCAYGTFNLLINPDEIKPKIKKTIKIKSKKIESLLYDFIDELLFLLDVDGLLLSKIQDMIIKKENETFILSCTITGDNYKNYDVAGNIKSMTYNDMEIKNTNGNYKITFVVDL